MAKSGVVIDGDKEIQRMFARLLESELRDELTEIMDEAGEIVLAEVKQRAPVRTGKLRDNIVKEDPTVKADEITLNVGPNREGFYGYFLEAGTSKLAPHPWIRPAHKAAKPKVDRFVADEIAKLIDREARKP
jgi:HK97 gp10 family phage protein